MSEVQILLLLLLSGYLISVSLGMVIIPRILVISHKKRLYDVPDSRKVHTTPVPRLGGLSFFPVVLMSFALVIGFRLYLWPSDLSSFSIEMLHEYLFLFVGMTLLYLVGVCDDLVGVGYRYKFIVQVVSALLLVLSGNWLDTLGGLFGIYSVPALLGVPVTVFAVVYVTNAINLIDGIDGLAFLIIHLCVSNSTSTERSDPYLVIAFSTVLVPLLDVVRVVLRRLREHKNPFLPDKNHFHHKLLRTGMRVRMVMVTIICVSVFFIALNIVLANHLNVNCILFLNLSLWTVLHLLIDWLIARNRQKRESAFDKRF